MTHEISAPAPGFSSLVIVTCKSSTELNSSNWVAKSACFSSELNVLICIIVLMSKREPLYRKVADMISRGVSYVYNKMHWFTDKDAWAMYRIVAILEAVGWTMLISSIIYRWFDLRPTISW